jgi:hypothetical protein
MAFIMTGFRFEAVSGRERAVLATTAYQMLAFELTHRGLVLTSQKIISLIAVPMSDQAESYSRKS